VHMYLTMYHEVPDCIFSKTLSARGEQGYK
jgi:hypothetical protein